MKVNIVVKPLSKKGPQVEETSEGLIVYVREPAVDFKANAAVVKLLASHFGVSKSAVRLLRGGTAKHKIFEVK